MKKKLFIILATGREVAAKNWLFIFAKNLSNAKVQANRRFPDRIWIKQVHELKE